MTESREPRLSDAVHERNLQGNGRKRHQGVCHLRESYDYRTRKIYKDLPFLNTRVSVKCMPCEQYVIWQRLVHVFKKPALGLQISFSNDR